MNYLYKLFDLAGYPYVIKYESKMHRSVYNMLLFVKHWQLIHEKMHKCLTYVYNYRRIWKTILSNMGLGEIWMVRRRGRMEA